MSHTTFLIIRDGLALALVFGVTAYIGIIYMQTTPSLTTLRERLPNKFSPSGIILFLVLIAWIWWALRGSQGFHRISTIYGILFNLLVFETFFVLLMRWIRINLIALGVALGLTGGLIALQYYVGNIFIYDVTFAIATFGASTLLIQMQWLRSRFLILVSLLWMIYDILSTSFIYPTIYKPAERPTSSFFFPAVGVGQFSLGSGDFMFLVLMTLILLRDRGRRVALFHAGIQAIALFITVAAKPQNTFWPYLTILVPIFLIVWFATRKRSPVQPASVRES